MDLFSVEEGSGEPLLLVHGAGAGSDTWERAQKVFGQSRRAIRYDRRAFGRSVGAPHRPPDYWRKHADDAAALLERLGARPAGVLGWSSGGIVALALALHHPRLVSRVALLEPPIWAKRAFEPSLLPGLLQMLFWRLLGQKRRSAEAFFRVALRERDGSDGYARLDPALREDLLGAVDAIFAETDSGTGEELSAEALRAVRVPVTLLVGDRSAAFLRRCSERLVAAAPQLQLQSIPDGTHMLPWDDAGRFVDAVRPYV